jgi:hypothetical protein
MPPLSAGGWPVARRKSRPAPEPETAAPVPAGPSLAARLAAEEDSRSDQMIWTALMGCRLGTDDVHLDAILAEHKRCPRGYCEHRQAVDRYSEVLGWDD